MNEDELPCTDPVQAHILLLHCNYLHHHQVSHLRLRNDLLCVEWDVETLLTQLNSTQLNSTQLRCHISDVAKTSISAITMAKITSPTDTVPAYVHGTLHIDRAARSQNSLLSTITAASILPSFHRPLKTHLLTISFPSRM